MSESFVNQLDSNSSITTSTIETSPCSSSMPSELMSNHDLAIDNRHASSDHVQDHRLLSSTEIDETMKSPMSTINEQQNATIVNTHHLNPDAPDFTFVDYSSGQPSLVLPLLPRRRSMIADRHNSRTRYHSETYYHPTVDVTHPSLMRPLLSLMPELNSPVWSISTSIGHSSWPEDHRQRSRTTTGSNQTLSAYKSLMEPQEQQQRPIDEHLYSSNQQQQQNRYGSKWQRNQGSRKLSIPSTIDSIRNRSYSGPEMSVVSTHTHLTGIHALTRIMVDILRMIRPALSNEQSQSISNSYSSIQSK
jgi:hypothetical protein